MSGNDLFSMYTTYYNGQKYQWPLYDHSIFVLVYRTVHALAFECERRKYGE